MRGTASSGAETLDATAIVMPICVVALRLWLVLSDFDSVSALVSLRKNRGASFVNSRKQESRLAIVEEIRVPRRAATF